MKILVLIFVLSHMAGPDTYSVNEDALYYINICRLLGPYDVYFPCLISFSALCLVFFILMLKSFT